LEERDWRRGIGGDGLEEMDWRRGIGGEVLDHLIELLFKK